MRRLSSKSPLTFAAELQTHEAQMQAAANKLNLTAKEKQVHISLIDSMALDSLITFAVKKRTSTRSLETNKKSKHDASH